MSRNNYISRVCIIHINSQSCLYDRIRPGYEDLWMSTDEKYDEDEYAMNIKFPVSGTKKERTMRQELMSLIKSLFLISRSIDSGSVFKAAFQQPAENRQSNFTVKFTPHFGNLARPKKNINTKISSMVFGQAETELVIASKIIQITNKKTDNNEEELKVNDNNNKSKGEFVCAVFYGVNCKPDTAVNLSKQLIDKFFAQFAKKLQRLLFRLETNNKEADEYSSDENEMNSNDDVGMEYIMAQFKSFDEIVDRLANRHVDSRMQRKISNRRLDKINNVRIKKHSSVDANTVENNNNKIIESKYEEDGY